MNQYECTKEGSNKAILLFKGEKTDSKGYIKRTYCSSESFCKNCPLREQYWGKTTKYKKIDDSIHKEHYDRMHKKLTQNPKYAKKMVRVLSKTVEPVIGTLVNFTNMKRQQIRTDGIVNLQPQEIPAFCGEKTIVPKLRDNPSSIPKNREELRFCKKTIL